MGILLGKLPRTLIIAMLVIAIILLPFSGTTLVHAQDVSSDVGYVIGNILGLGFVIWAIWAFIDWLDGPNASDISAREFAPVLITPSLPNQSDLRLGMTDREARGKFGSPDDINRTVGPWGTHEQWVYRAGDSLDAVYLYFEDGVLTSWQN